MAEIQKDLEALPQTPAGSQFPAPYKKGSGGLVPGCGTHGLEPMDFGYAAKYCIIYRTVLFFTCNKDFHTPVEESESLRRNAS
jgi:hypothetical protein